MKILGNACRRVAVDDNGSEIALMAQEIVPYPNQVVFGLGIECDTRPHPGMSKKIASRAEPGPQAPVELQVIVRKRSAKRYICFSQPSSAAKEGVLNNAMFNAV